MVGGEPAGVSDHGLGNPQAVIELRRQASRPHPSACPAGAFDKPGDEGHVVAGDRVDEAVGDPFHDTRDDVAPAAPIFCERLWSRQMHPVGKSGIVQRLRVVRMEHVELDRDRARAARPQHADEVGVAGVGDGLGPHARMPLAPRASARRGRS